MWQKATDQARMPFKCDSNAASLVAAAGGQALPALEANSGLPVANQPCLPTTVLLALGDAIIERPASDIRAAAASQGPLAPGPL